VKVELGIARWRALGSTLGGDEFARQFAHPFLLCIDWEAAKRQPAGAQTDSHIFRTGAIDEEAIEELTSRDWSSAFVAPVVKAGRQPFEFVSVGRANNCDIVVPDSSVSKLHVTFKVLSPSDAEMIDVGSKNGTQLNFERVGKKEAVHVCTGDQLRFGRIPFEFLDPSAFFARL
jgi:hypothetical protein